MSDIKSDDQPYAALHITVLRGRHTYSSAEAVRPLVQTADIICVESFGAYDDVKAARQSANALSNDEEYIKSFSKDPEQYINNNMILRLAWDFRGQGKVYYPVDVEYKTDAELQRYSFGSDIHDVIKALYADPEDRYELMRAFLLRECQKIIDRDRIVASQMRHLLTYNDGIIWKPIAAKKGYCEVVVVQGFLHDVSTLLKHYFPGSHITRKMYAEADTKLFMRENVGSMLLAKQLTNSKPKFTDKEIDYYLYQLTTMNISSDVPDSSDMIDKLRWAGTKEHEEQYRQHRAEYMPKPIDDYDAQELKVLVDAELAKETQTE